MKSTRVILAVLVVVAFVIRLSFFLGDEQPQQLSGLSAGTGEVAHNIDRGRWFVINQNSPLPGVNKPTRHLVDPASVDFTQADAHPRDQNYVIHMPGAAVILAGIWKVVGDEDFGWMQMLQVILGSLMVLVVYWIAMRLFRRTRTALIAAGIYALALQLAALMKLPFYDTWATLTVPPVVALWLKAAGEEGRRRTWLLIATGLLAGVGIWFRPPIGLLPVALALASIPHWGWRRALPLAWIPLVASLAVLAPWTVKNAVQYDRFIPTNTGAGQVLWQGLGEQPNDFGAHNNDGLTFQQVHKVRPDLVYGTPDYDSFLMSWGTKAIREHPGHYANVVYHRILRGTVQQHDLTWINHADTLYRERSSLTGFATAHPWEAFEIAMSKAGDPLFILFALGTLIATWRRFRDEHLLLLAVILATLVVPVILGLEWRYIAPAAFVYMILFGLGVDVAIERLGNRRRTNSISTSDPTPAATIQANTHGAT